MSKHTKGPWYAEGKYVGSASGSICDCFGIEKSKEAQANARLIAAAPDMLAALKKAENLIDTICPLEGDDVRQIRKAIAMAEGGAA